MKKMIYGIAILSMSACVGGLSGCQALEAAKNNIAAGISASGLKSDIEARCKQYEENGDGEGMKAYCDGLLNAEPKPEGWDSSIVELINAWLQKAHAMLLAKSNGELLKAKCSEIFKEVKAALDKRDFDTARKLTATAAPCTDEKIRDAVLVYRIGVLNEIINPYQSDWIIYQMKTKVRELKNAGKNSDEINAYLNSVGLIKDTIPSIEQKVREIKPGLENLYWLDDRIQDYLRENISEIQRILDARNVGGEYRDYKEVYDLVDLAVAEMKLYTPTGEEASKDVVIMVNNWETSMKSVRRVMTTDMANKAITEAKESLAKSLSK